MQQTPAERDLISAKSRQQHAPVPAVKPVRAHKRRQVLCPSGVGRRRRRRRIVGRVEARRRRGLNGL